MVEKQYFCYLNYDEFMNFYDSLKDVSTTDFSGLTAKEIYAKKINIFRLRVGRVLNLPEVSDLGKLFSFGSESSYHDAKKKLTFLTKDSEEICFLHDVPTGEPAGLEKIYEMLRSEINQKEAYHQRCAELEKYVRSEGESLPKPSIPSQLKQDCIAILNALTEFFTINFNAIVSYGDSSKGEKLFGEVAKIQKELGDLK